MSQVEHQLREYFDAGVERVSADDVIARVALDEERAPRSRRRLHPAWVAVGAFALTLVLFGGAFIAVGLIEQAGGNVASGGFGPIPAPAGSLGLWPFAAVGVAGISALSAWILRVRSHTAVGRDEDEGRVELMETMEEAQIEDSTTQQLAQRNRWLIGGVVVLTVALMALGAWVLFGTRANSPTAAPAEVAQLMDDYVAAWNNYDVDALEALVTPGYRLYSSDGTFDHDVTSLREYLIPFISERNWVNTYEGPWYAVGGDGGVWAVSDEGAVITGDVYLDGEGMQNGVMRVVEFGDSLLVDEHVFIGVDE